MSQAGLWSNVQVSSYSKDQSSVIEALNLLRRKGSKLDAVTPFFAAIFKDVEGVRCSKGKSSLLSCGGAGCFEASCKGDGVLAIRMDGFAEFRALPDQGVFL